MLSACKEHKTSKTSFFFPASQAMLSTSTYVCFCEALFHGRHSPSSTFAYIQYDGSKDNLDWRIDFRYFNFI